MILTFLIGLQILLAIILDVIILLQNGKGADIGSAFGSGNNNGMLGPIESGTVVTTSTWVLVFLFFIYTLGISVYEGLVVGTIPLVPDRLSYSEMWSDTIKYPSEWTADLESAKKNIEHIKNRIRILNSDNVNVEVTPYDLTKGRIVFRF